MTLFCIINLLFLFISSSSSFSSSSSSNINCLSEFTSVTLRCQCVADSYDNTLTATCWPTSQRDPCYGDNNVPYTYVCTSRLSIDIFLNETSVYKTIRFTRNYTYEQAVDELGGVEQPKYCVTPLLDCGGLKACTPYSTGVSTAKSAHFSVSNLQFWSMTERVTSFYNPGCSKDCVLSTNVYPQAPCSVTCGTGVQPWARNMISPVVADGDCFNPWIYRKCEMTPCDLPSNNTSAPLEMKHEPLTTPSINDTSGNDGAVLITTIVLSSVLLLVSLLLIIAHCIQTSQQKKQNKNVQINSIKIRK